MALMREVVSRPGTRTLAGSLDVASSVEAAFSLLCAVEKWPVWLSFLRSARLRGAGLQAGSEVVVRSAIPGEDEELYEVDSFVENFHLSLVGAYSVRRRIDLRIERRMRRIAQMEASRVHVRVEYPNYGGRVGALLDALTAGRRLSLGLAESLQQFKSLVEFENRGAALADF